MAEENKPEENKGKMVHPPYCPTEKEKALEKKAQNSKTDTNGRNTIGVVKKIPVNGTTSTVVRTVELGGSDGDIATATSINKGTHYAKNDPDWKNRMMNYFIRLFTGEVIWIRRVVLLLLLGYLIYKGFQNISSFFATFIPLLIRGDEKFNEKIVNIKPGFWFFDENNNFVNEKGENEDPYTEKFFCEELEETPTTDFLINYYNRFEKINGLDDNN